MNNNCNDNYDRIKKKIEEERERCKYCYIQGPRGAKGERGERGERGGGSPAQNPRRSTTKRHGQSAISYRSGRKSPHKRCAYLWQ